MSRPRRAMAIESLSGGALAGELEHGLPAHAGLAAEERAARRVDAVRQLEPRRRDEELARSSPPNAHAVTRPQGSGTTASSVPSGA